MAETNKNCFGQPLIRAERGLIVGFCGQPHYCYRLYYPTARFQSPSSYVISDEPFQGPRRANLHKWGFTQLSSCDCGQRLTMNHIVDTCPLTKVEGALNILHEANAVTWLESTATASLTKYIVDPLVVNSHDSSISSRAAR